MRLLRIGIWFLVLGVIILMTVKFALSLEHTRGDTLLLVAAFAVALIAELLITVWLGGQ